MGALAPNRLANVAPALNMLAAVMPVAAMLSYVAPADNNCAKGAPPAKLATLLAALKILVIKLGDKLAGPPAADTI